jgi:hypothetical protein
VSLTQRQCAALLANAFLCTFPHRHHTVTLAGEQKYPSVNFHTLFGGDGVRGRRIVGSGRLTDRGPADGEHAAAAGREAALCAALF